MIITAPNLPFDVLNIILQYDGRIKYSHKDRMYVNIISKNDYRYSAIKTKINIQLRLIQTFIIGNEELRYYVDVYYKSNFGLLFSLKPM